MNWYIGEVQDGTWYARCTGADGSVILTVMGLTRSEATGYPIRWILENIRSTALVAAEVAASRETALLRALSEVQPQGRPS